MGQRTTIIWCKEFVQRMLRYYDSFSPRFPRTIENFLRSHIVNSFIYTFFYDIYVDTQLHRSGWSRQSLVSRQGLDVAYRVILPWLNAKTVVADIGCGDGYILDSLRDKVGLCFGIDLHMGKLTDASIHGNLVTQGDLHNLPFPSKSIDIIHCNHVLEHALQVNLVLKEFQRVMRPGGKLLLVVPSTGGNSIKHPTAFFSEQGVFRTFEPYFRIERVWTDHTREDEFWVTCTAEI